MAKIPSVQDFGGTPTPGTSRPMPNVRGVGRGVQQGANIISADADRAGSGTRNLAAGLEDAGVKIAQAEDRINAGREAVERARALGTYGEEAVQELRRLQTEGDFSSLGTMQEYGKFLKERRDKIIGEHPGGDESKLRLLERLEGQRFQLVGQASALATDAQQKLLDETYSKQLNPLVVQASENPSSIAGLFQSLDGSIDDLAPALSPEREVQLRRAGREQIAIAGVESLANRGDIAGAEKILNETPGLDDIIGAEAGRKLRAKITIARAAEEKAKKAGLLKLQELTQILGREPTADERTRLAGVAPPRGRQTLSDKIVDFEKVMGRPATEQEISKMAGASEGGDFGAGITGRALSIMTDDAPAFSAGLLSETEERRFISAVTQYAQPKTIQNPDTGLMETRRPELPPFVKDAFERRGIPAPQQTFAQGGQPGQPVQPSAPGQPSRQPPEQTIWGLAGRATGPIPAIGETLSRTPLVGEVVRAPEMTQARQFIPLVQRDLIRVLQNNPKYAEGERKAIEAEININPTVFDTPNAFRDRLIAIDQALEVRERNAFETARSASVGRDERIQSMNVLNALVQFRQNLGVPVRVKTAEEAKKLPPGTPFIDPQGNVRTVP